MESPLSPEQLFGPEPHRRVLDNGLTVLCAPEHTAGLLSVQVWVRTGSMHEGELLGAGLSHYLEHMVFKGTARYSCRELNQAVQQTGGTMNAYTTFDRTVYHIDLPAEGADTAFDVLAEMMLRARLDPDDTAREREVILREIDMRDDDPDSLLAEAVLAETFHVHPYRLPVIGLRAAFEQVTREQLFSYYKARYVPNNMVLVVAGAIAPDAAFALAEKYFGAAPASALGAPSIPAEPPQLARRRDTLRADVQVLRGCLAWRIPGMRHPDAPALDVFAILMGLGQSSRLSRRLHDELGLVHQIDASNWAPGETGLFWLWFTADPGQREKVEKAVQETVATALLDGFAEAEFAKARRACLMAFLENRKTVSGLAGQLGAQAVVVGDLGYPRLYLERIQALTPAAVLAAARRHIAEDRLTCLAMEPRSEKNTASDDVQTAPTAPVPFEEVRLENGLRLLLQVVPGYPKVNYRALFLAGGVCETPGRRGLAALTATLMARDTARRNASEVAAAAELVGASLHETAGNNSIGLAIEVLSGDEPLAHDLLAEGILRPVFREETFLLERAAQRASLQEDSDDVVEFGKRRLREQFFGEHPFAIDYLGRVPDLDGLTAADARALHRRLAVPENCVIAVSGAFDRAAVLADMRRRFSSWQGGAELPTTPPFGPPAATGRVEETQPREQAVVFLAYPDAGIADEDYVAGQLLDELLSGMASQLFVSVREERGLAYFVGSSRMSAPRGGLFYLYAGTSPEHVETVLAAMTAEVARLRTGDIGANEIAAGKIRLRTAQRMARQIAGSRALHAGLNALYGLPVNRDAAWEQSLDALDAAALANFVKRHLREEASLTYIVRPEA